MSQAGNAPASDPPGALIGILAGASIGFAAQGSLPILIGAVIDGLGVNEAAAGLLASLEIGTVALASLLLAPRIHRIPRRKLALLGARIACVGQGLAVFAQSFETLLAARIVAGLGEGTAFAAANAALAGSVNPERLSALLALVGGAGAGVLLAVLPHIVEPWGYAGGFAALLVVNAVSLPLLRFLPEAPDASAQPRAGHPAHRVLGVATLLAFFVLALGESAMWAFTERIGLGVGLSRGSVGTVLAVTMVFGLVGAALAGWLGTRRGRALPLALGLTGLGVATVFLGSAQVWTVYAAMLLLWTFTFLFVMPYLMGTAAALDKEGRWAAATIGFWSVGSALGPASAGTLIALLSYAAVGRLVGACALVCLLLLLPAAFALRAEVPQARQA